MLFVDQPEVFLDRPAKDRDAPNLRIVTTRLGEIKLERRDPHGFVHVVWWAGPTPAALSGAYTDFDKARAAVASYISNEGSALNSLADKVEPKAPPLKTKG